MVTEVDYTAAAGSGKLNQIVSYTYDALGRQQSVNDAGQVTTSHYDAQGNLNEQETPQGTINYVYDPATGRHTETYTSYTDTVYGYNGLGQLESVTVKKLNGTTLTTPLVTRYAYDAVGDKLTETLPSGEVSTYGYDGLNRLTSVSETQGTTTVFSQSFVLNADGTRASSLETQLQPDDTVVTMNYSWDYDADSRLVRESLSATGNATASNLNYTDVYAFDLNGNQITDTHTGPGVLFTSR